MIQCKQPQWEMSDTSHQELLSINGDPRVRIQIIADTVPSIHWLQQGHPQLVLPLKIQVVSNFFYTTPMKKWVGGFGFRVWEAGIWAQPIHSMFTSTISAFAPEQAQHHQQVKLFGKQREKKLKLGICWAIASRCEQILTTTVGFISSGLSYLSNFLLGSMARNECRRWFIVLRIVPELCLVQCPLGVSLTSAAGLRVDDELFHGSRLMMWNPAWVKEVKLNLRRAGSCAPSLQAGVRLGPAQWLGTPPHSRVF